jgi:hypothetical protein
MNPEIVTPLTPNQSLIMTNGTWKPPENTPIMDEDLAMELGNDNDDEMNMDITMDGGAVAVGRSERAPSTAEEGPIDPASATTT